MHSDKYFLGALFLQFAAIIGLKLEQFSYKMASYIWIKKKFLVKFSPKIWSHFSHNIEHNKHKKKFTLRWFWLFWISRCKILSASQHYTTIFKAKNWNISEEFSTSLNLCWIVPKNRTSKKPAKIQKSQNHRIVNFFLK